jgi:hypothetical protein
VGSVLDNKIIIKKDATYWLKKNFIILMQNWSIHKENHWKNKPSKLMFWCPQQEMQQSYRNVAV